jgi:hypothetical protein
VDNLVIIFIVYALDNWCHFPPKRILFLRNFVQTGLGPTYPPDEIVLSFHFLNLRRSKLEVDCSPPSGKENEIACSYTSPSPERAQNLIIHFLFITRFL